MMLGNEVDEVDEIYGIVIGSRIKWSILIFKMLSIYVH